MKYVSCCFPVATVTLTLLLLASSLTNSVATRTHPSARQQQTSSIYPSKSIVRDEHGLFRYQRSPESLPVAGTSSNGTLFPRLAPKDNSTSDWMGNLYETLSQFTLKDMVLPGTHDSGAYALTTNLSPDAGGSEWIDAAITIAEKLGIPVNDVITPWALSQTTDFYEQAMGGIRYFDLRICYNGSEFLTYHFETGNTILTLMNDLNEFLRDHPTEIVVIEGQLWQPPNDTIPDSAKQRFMGDIGGIFDGLLHPEYDAFNLTYAQLIESGYRVIFTIDDSDMYRYGQSPTSGGSSFQWAWDGHSTIWNTYANTHEYDKLNAYDILQMQTFNSLNGTSGGSPVDCDRYATPTRCLYKLSWTLTTDGTAILDSLLPGHPHSLIEMADTANVQLNTWMQQNHVEQQDLKIGNIFIIDDFTNSPIMDIILKQNADPTRKKAVISAPANENAPVNLYESIAEQ